MVADDDDNVDGDGDYKDDDDHVDGDNKDDYDDDDNKSCKRLHHKQAALHRRVRPHFSHTKPLLTRPL